MLLTDRALELAPSELGKTIEPFNFHGLQFLRVEIEEAENCGRDSSWFAQRCESCAVNLGLEMTRGT